MKNQSKPRRQPSEFPSSLEESQLRKLSLEIEALEKQLHLQSATAKSQQEKVELEVASLRWQNRWSSRLTQFAALATIAISLAGAWFGYSKLIADRQKDRDSARFLMRERAENQLRADVKE
ncbi:MAG TPA: hypothetical protein VJZ91_15135, partial [Blastocatellia bacterium]|nr:hypothetical protein [Blastocatellia bacterium]